MKKFTAQSIDFSYTDNPLLTQASLEVAQGDIVGILGPMDLEKQLFSISSVTSRKQNPAT